MKATSEQSVKTTNHFKPPKRKTPQSRISDLLPSNLIDEIECNQPTLPKQSLFINIVKNV